MISMHSNRPFAVSAVWKYSVRILCCAPFAALLHFLFLFSVFLLHFPSSRRYLNPIVSHSTSALIVRAFFQSLLLFLVWFFSAHVKHFPFNSFPLLNTNEKKTICTDKNRWFETERRHREREKKHAKNSVKRARSMKKHCCAMGIQIMIMACVSLLKCCCCCQNTDHSYDSENAHQVHIVWQTLLLN